MNAIPSKLAYSYIRFSSLEQAKGDSLRRQTVLSEEYAEKHGLQLDRSLSIRDLGVSAFRGKNRRATGGLAAFIRAVETGRVRRGSVLLVESLDRLSREAINKALRLFLDLLERGITIVTLADGMTYTEESVGEHPGSLMMSIVIMWRANEESATKSRRVAKAAEKRRNSLGEKKYTSICPSWLNFNKKAGAFELIEEHAKIVRWIFAQADKGLGKYVIARLLNDKGVETWGAGPGKARKARKWHSSYIDKILNSEAVTGRFQPCKMVDGQRTPVGDVAEGYFPRVVPDGLFERVRRHASGNKKRKGKVGSRVGNLFTHLAFCATTGAPAIFSDKGKWKYIRSDGVVQGGRKLKGWPYAEFEECFLSSVGALDLSQILGQNDGRILDAENALGEAERKLRETRKKIDTLTAVIEDGGDLRPLVERLQTLVGDESALVSTVEEIQSRVTIERRVVEEAGLTAKNLRKLMGEKSPEKRLLLRQEIRRVVARIDIEFEMEPTAEEAAARAKLLEKLKYLRRKGAVLPAIPGKGRAMTLTFVNGATRRVEEGDPGQPAFASELEGGRVQSGFMIFQPGLVPPGKKSKPEPLVIPARERLSPRLLTRR